MTATGNYSISELVAEHFPGVYQEDAPLLVEFVKEYFRWMESQGPVYHSRRFLDYTDIDKTVDEFIVHFKETYLKGVQLDTATNTKQLIKHSLDLYRAKGSQNAVQLFFRLVFGENAEVYYPSTDVFILSDGQWVVPTYLEITPSKYSETLVGQQITGINSGATAFVEKLVRKSIDGSYADILMISSVVGKFSANELIRLSKSQTVIPEFPFVKGSLSGLSVVDGGTQFVVGDTVEIISATGRGGKARVSAINALTGLVDFELINGGWGYSTANAIPLVTTEVLRLSNIFFSTSGNTSPYSTQIRTLSQPKANVAFANASGVPIPGDYVFTYFANNAIKGKGQIMSIETSNSSVGDMYVAVISGNLQGNAFYTTGNLISANQTSYTDLTATAMVYGLSSNVYMYYSNATSSVSKNEKVFQYDDNGQILVIATAANVAPNTSIDGELKVNNVQGMFLNNRKIYTSNGFSANIGPLRADVGIANVSGIWTNLPYNIVYDSLSTSTATVNDITSGSGASFQYSPTLAYTEYVNLNTDILAPYSNVALNAATYGLGLGTANLSTVMDSALNYANTILGQITALTHLNPGANYNYPPFVQVREQLVIPYMKQDYVLYINGASGVFAAGELITQGGTSAQSIVKKANTTVVQCTRMNFNDQWIATTNSTTRIVGTASGFSANLVSFAEDPTSGFIGDNAIVDAAVVTSNTAVKSLQILDSGFNYADGETIEFTNGTNSGTAIADVNTQGIGLGYSRSTSSLLSGDKYLADGYYYQDFSYEIRSPVTLERYESMLKKILHVAGTKYFTAFNKESVFTIDVDPSTTIEIDLGLIMSSGAGQANGRSSAVGATVTGVAAAGNAAGVGVGDGRTLSSAAGAAAGVGAALGDGTSLTSGGAVGSASGIGDAKTRGGAQGIAAATGNAAGTGSASAAGGLAPGVGVGSAAGTGAASAASKTIIGGDGVARGTSSATGAGASTAAAAGSASGTGAASGAGASNAAAAGSAAGTGAASGASPSTGGGTDTLLLIAIT